MSSDLVKTSQDNCIVERNFSLFITELRQRQVGGRTPTPGSQVRPPFSSGQLGSNPVRPQMRPRLQGPVRPGMTPYGPRGPAQGMQPRNLMANPQTNGYGMIFMPLLCLTGVQLSVRNLYCKLNISHLLIKSLIYKFHIWNEGTSHRNTHAGIELVLNCLDHNFYIYVWISK